MIFKDDIQLALYGLRYSIYNAYKIFGFAHGDIPNGRNYNLMADVEYVGKSVDGSERLNPIKYVMFKTRIGDQIYRYIYRLSKPNYVPKIIIIDFGYSNISYADHTIQTKIANDDINVLPTTLEKLKHDLFGSKNGPEIMGFSLYKFLKMAPFDAAANTIRANQIVDSNSVDLLITSTMPVPNNIRPNNGPNDSPVGISLKPLATTDETAFNELFGPGTNNPAIYDPEEILIYSNMKRSNEIYTNVNTINPEFEGMINAIIRNKI
jgi:hypothetical protein